VELHGIELTQLADTDVEVLLALLDEYKVVVVRGADLTPDEHIDLARRFGPLQLHPYLANLRSPQPHILVMEGTRALAHTFHTDESFLDKPPVTCVLRMHTLPRSGGDTTWINLEAAYAALPMGTQDRLAAARGVHRTLDGDRETRHPLVRVHPRTLRPALFVGRLYTCGVEGAGEDSEALLAALLEHSEDARFGCRLEWTPGDVVIWDNCCTLHRVADDFTTYRRVERVAVAGERPEPFGG
jgi:Probable taurine catabolism dioxygenase